MASSLSSGLAAAPSASPGRARDDAIAPSGADGPIEEPSGAAGSAGDITRPFAWVPGIRWASLGVGLAVAVAQSPRGPLRGAVTTRTGHVVAWGIGLVVWSALSASRRFQPLVASRLGLIADVAVNTAVVLATGYWSSPYAFCLLAAVMAAAALRGFAFSIRATAAAVVTIALPHQLWGAGQGADRLQSSVQWAAELVLVVILAGYARFLFGQAQERQSVALDRVSQLSEANDLLVSLHRVAQSLPASLNLEQVLSSSLARLRGLVDYDVGAILLRDETSGHWVVRAGDGVRVGRSFADHELPTALRDAATSSVTSMVVCLGPGQGLGPEALAKSGLYAPLRACNSAQRAAQAQGSLIGLIAVEQRDAGRYDRRELRLLDGFIDPVALAIDNARWFARLRTMGADEERIRIARDIHDSVGQSLAYVAFRLDTAMRMAESTPLRDELDGLRGDVRCVLAEVRDALCDLRTDVSDEQSLVETLEVFLERTGARTEMEISFKDMATDRLPVVQEREVWRIAQEAVTNVEHHARARHLRVRWECDGARARLTVADDGQGFDTAKRARIDSYGITGMKERADAIGARLEIDSERYVGTVLECVLEP